MNNAEYMEAVESTAIYPDAGKGTTKALTYVSLGLVGEAGEVANKFKKVIRGDLPLEDARPDMADELGDVLWYVARLAAELGLTLGQVQQMNVWKLESRKRRGTLRGSGDTR